MSHPSAPAAGGALHPDEEHSPASSPAPVHPLPARAPVRGAPSQGLEGPGGGVGGGGGDWMEVGVGVGGADGAELLSYST